MNNKPIKVGVILPTRGDRPHFLAKARRLLAAQTYQPAVVTVQDYAPESAAKDITQRYRRGYDALRGFGLDFILFWEDDDYYAPNYIEYMVGMWSKYRGAAGEVWPVVMGLNRTVYYHLHKQAWFELSHDRRITMANALIVPDLPIEWGEDSYPYTDLALRNTYGVVTFEAPHGLHLGIKHGVGLCGGYHHNDKMERYVNSDADGAYFATITGCEPWIYLP